MITAKKCCVSDHTPCKGKSHTAILREGHPRSVLNPAASTVVDIDILQRAQSPPRLSSQPQLIQILCVSSPAPAAQLTRTHDYCEEMLREGHEQTQRYCLYIKQACVTRNVQNMIKADKIIGLTSQADQSKQSD